MRTVVGVALGLATGTALGWAIAWQFGGRSATASSGSKNFADTAFELDGQFYPESDFPLAVRTLLYDERRTAFDDQKSLITQLAVRLSLARQANPAIALKDVAGLEELITIPDPSDAEARQVFDENRARLPAQASFEQVKGEVIAFIKADRFGAAVRHKALELSSQGRFHVVLDEPQAPLVELPIEGLPTRGSASSKHVLVEVFDYLCPHCQAIQPELVQLLAEHDGQLRFVAMNYSLKPDALSGILARGAFCASQQSEDAFWRFHEEVFVEAKRKKWSIADAGVSEAATDIARSAGIDVDAMRRCINSDEAKEHVVKTNGALAAVGMTGTPTFFLDGRKISHQGSALREQLLRLSPKKTR